MPTFHTPTRISRAFERTDWRIFLSKLMDPMETLLIHGHQRIIGIITQVICTICVHVLAGGFVACLTNAIYGMQF